MDEGGEVEASVVKWEEGKKERDFFLSCTRPEEEVLAASGVVSILLIFLDVHVTSRGYFMPD